MSGIQLSLSNMLAVHWSPVFLLILNLHHTPYLVGLLYSGLELIQMLYYMSRTVGLHVCVVIGSLLHRELARVGSCMHLKWSVKQTSTSRYKDGGQFRPSKL